jgi:hypothetical protein
MTDPRADTYTHPGMSARVFPANKLMTARHTAALLGIFRPPRTTRGAIGV